MLGIKPDYQSVKICPLCKSVGLQRSKLTRTNYYFGKFAICLPNEGVYLCECTKCSLLFKSAVPTKEFFSKVMSESATHVWQPKLGVHPALDLVLPYLKKPLKSVLDVGASNGDLISQLKPFTSSVSAIDVVEYPQCRLVTKEYIISEIEGVLDWSGDKYDVVTAFDIFEHFLNTQTALTNISSTLKNGGYLIVETGDWDCYKHNLGQWYYANLFEHQIFWNKKSFGYFCEQYGYSIVEYKNCIHKGRRNLGLLKRYAMELVVQLSSLPMFQRLVIIAGKGDPLRFASTSLVDHAFIVMMKNNV
jgi:hypothetical protein